MRRKCRCSTHLQMPSRPSMASDTVWGEIVGRCWVQSFEKPLYPRKQLTNGIPDAKLGPCPRRYLCHQVNIHEDADQWEDRQSRDLWAESVHPLTQPRCLKGRPCPTCGQRDSSPIPAGCSVSAQCMQSTECRSGFQQFPLFPG